MITTTNKSNATVLDGLEARTRASTQQNCATTVKDPLLTITAQVPDSISLVYGYVQGFIISESLIHVEIKKERSFTFAEF